MTRAVRRSLSLAVLVATTIIAVPSFEQPASAATSDASTLSVGETLRPGSDPSASSIASANTSYQLGIYYNATSPTSGGVGLEIDQLSPVVGAGLWTQTGTATPQAFALMQSNGNFVLYARPGVPIWSTHTAGTGTDNRLVMQDDGNLVMYTSTGHRVWASGTHAEVLSSGENLLPGQHLTNAYSHTDPPTTLTMQHDGDLVVRFHGVVVWASNTSVPGAYLRMRSDGKLLIQSGTRVLWKSQTGGLTDPSKGRPFLDVKPAGHFTVNFTPPDATGGGITVKYDSQEGPGEWLRTSDGDLRYLTRDSLLKPGRSLRSSNGYRLTMQSNGNLVQRGPSGELLWQTGTAGHPGAALKVLTDGRMVVFLDSHVLWGTRTNVGSYEHRIVSVVTQNNGNVVARGPTGLVLWTSRTAG